MNDITALGYEVPVLSAPQLRRIDSGSANQSGVYQALVVGIGTGFDVSSVLQVGGKTLCPSVGAEHVSLPSSIGRMLRQWGPSAPKPPRIFAEQNEKRYHRATQQAGMPMAVNWSCHAFVPVSELIYAAFRSNAKGLLPPSDECLRLGL